MKFHTKQQLKWIFWTTILMAIGLVLFKYIPMYINYLRFGTSDILYDASSHIVWTSWGLYVVWFFIDQKKSWRIPYFIFSGVVLVIMGIERIIVKAHNEVGIMMGLIVAFFAIVIPRWKEFKRGLKF
jgi:membrane-associated phospholipid phosphatase